MIKILFRRWAQWIVLKRVKREPRNNDSTFKITLRCWSVTYYSYITRSDSWWMMLLKCMDYHKIQHLLLLCQDSLAPFYCVMWNLFLVRLNYHIIAITVWTCRTYCLIMISSQLTSGACRIDVPSRKWKWDRKKIRGVDWAWKVYGFLADERNLRSIISVASDITFFVNLPF